MRYLVSHLFGLLACTAQAQWASVGGGILTGNVNMVHYDSLEQRLYMVGDQRYMLADNMQVNGVCYWDGTAWSAFGTGVDDPGIGLVSPVRAMCKYDSALFVAGSFFGMGSVPNTRRVAKWQDGAWHSCGLDSLAQPYGSALRLTVIDDTMHLLSADAIVYQGDTILRWAKYDGENWFAGDASEDWSYAPTSVVKYQGQLYVGGNFDLSGGQNDLVRRTASGWEVLGQGLLGDPWVNDMIEYDGLLWVVGEFYRFAGNPGSGIMVWDGIQWLDPFPMLDMFAQGRDLEIIDGKLYFTGAMNVDGMADYYGVGRYDGEELCIIGGPEVFALNLTGNADTLYMATCGTHTCYPDGLPVNGIAKWPMDVPPDICFDVEVGIGEHFGTILPPSLHPNPLSTTALLHVPTTHARPSLLAWHDATGRLVRTDAPHWQGNALLIERGALPPGLYFLRSGPGHVLRVLVQ